MPVPEEVNGWVCSSPPDNRSCIAEWEDCDTCHGTGKEGKKRCCQCAGSGGGYCCGTHDLNAPFDQGVV